MAPPWEGRVAAVPFGVGAPCQPFGFAARMVPLPAACSSDCPSFLRRRPGHPCPGFPPFLLFVFRFQVLSWAAAAACDGHGPFRGAGFGGSGPLRGMEATEEVVALCPYVAQGAEAARAGRKRAACPGPLGGGSRRALPDSAPQPGGCPGPAAQPRKESGPSAHGSSRPYRAASPQT